MNRLAVAILAVCLWTVSLICQLNAINGMSVLTGLFATLLTFKVIGDD